MPTLARRARRARAHLAAALIAAALLPISTAGAVALTAARATAWPSRECLLCLGMTVISFPYEYDTLATGCWWWACSQ